MGNSEVLVQGLTLESKNQPTTVSFPFGSFLDYRVCGLAAPLLSIAVDSAVMSDGYKASLLFQSGPMS